MLMPMLMSMPMPRFPNSPYLLSIIDLKWVTKMANKKLQNRVKNTVL